MPDLRLLSSPPDTVTRVEIMGGAGDTGAASHNRRLVLARRPGGAWRFEAPKVAYAADPRAIDDWLAALRNVEARPAPAAVNPVHVPKPAQLRRLTIDGRTHETAVVAPGDPGYALVDPDPLRFRDRLVLDFAHFDARELRRSGDGQTVELTSADGDNWRVVAPPGADRRSHECRAGRGRARQPAGGGVRPRGEGAVRRAGALPDDRRPAARRAGAAPAHARRSTKEKRRPVVPDASIVTSHSRSPRRPVTSSAWGC